MFFRRKKEFNNWKKEIKMIDLFTIFSKGGIVLWYFHGTTQLLTCSVNELIKNVILQVK